MDKLKEGEAGMAADRRKQDAAEARPAKLTGPEQVAEFLSQLDHPQKREIEEVRRIILGASSEITEQIKWNAPSFCWRNEDRITMNLQGKGRFRLVFHCGAKPKKSQLQGTLLEDATGLLEWAAPDRAIVTITDTNDVDAKRKRLTELVMQWIEAADA